MRRALYGGTYNLNKITTHNENRSRRPYELYAHTKRKHEQ